RCLEELKLESLTLHDEPLLLWRAIGRLACTASSGTAVGSPPAAQGDARRRAEERVALALRGRPFRRLLLRWVLRHARARVRDRENLRFERTRVFARVRRIFVELGRRLHEDVHLQEPRDIFYLEIDEVLNLVAGAATTTRLKQLVSVRQAEFAEYRAAEPPPDRFTTETLVPGAAPWLRRPSSGAEGAEDRREGTGCSAGVVHGRVRKIVDPRSGVIHAGEILVAERTDPGWVMLFASAAGLLVERGSLLSHSAIVAREMRIPAIVSIPGLIAWLRDGDWVELDGSTGIVRKIEPAPSIPEHASVSPQLIGNESQEISSEEARAPALRL
ncbi:MAG: PEP-utilizing enzyme, partial [Verrucomicrobiota bacterium]|nr:PEP-utilizing enzyme [Verrucomicrobiota bacterium]